MFLGNKIIGPFFYDYNLNSERYLELLRTKIIPAIRQVVNDQEWNELYFQQDGCPAHNANIVSEYLTEQFGERIIKNQGPILWPARSPDLTPLDFFLWGYLKNEVYKLNPPQNIEDLKERIQNVINTINRHTLTKVMKNVQKRCEKCLTENGGHIENFNV